MRFATWTTDLEIRRQLVLICLVWCCANTEAAVPQTDKRLTRIDQEATLLLNADSSWTYDDNQTHGANRGSWFETQYRKESVIEFRLPYGTKCFMTVRRNGELIVLSQGAMTKGVPLGPCVGGVYRLD